MGHSFDYVHFSIIVGTIRSLDSLRLKYHHSKIELVGVSLKAVPKCYTAQLAVRTRGRGIVGH